jgi:hypothetical protein
MSALFELNAGLVDRQVSLNRSLELRQIPHLREVIENYPPRFESVASSEYSVDRALMDISGNLDSNWTFSAVNQVTLNKSGPRWSKDGWSFIPIDLSHDETVKGNYRQADSEKTSMFTNYSPINVTVKSPALRARLECSPSVRDPDYEWPVVRFDQLSPNNITTTGHIVSPTWSLTTPECNYSTDIAPWADGIYCCYNLTKPSKVGNSSMPVVVGYWTTITTSVTASSL